jgi:hypothetical protein
MISMQIGCMDELSLHLSSTSIKERRSGQGTAHLRHAGMKGAQASVILATTASGRLLPPLLILKVTHPLLGVDVMSAIFNNFSEFSAKKLAFSSKTNVLINFLHHLALL